jgi:signal transduction histidine kinase
MSSSPLDPDNLAAGVTFTAIDITSQKQAEKEKEQIEAQYRQAQKVEAIGQLAGGVAHDLNNMLTPIIAYSDLLLIDIAQNDPARMKLEQILKAGNLARDLVRQLLAFSRRQTLEYKPLDLNQALRDFELLLSRTIRENIEINILSFSDVAPVMADIGQIEQVIINLAINAADSMPDGGKLTIETLPVTIDAEYKESHPGAQPGRYIMLAVSDTGHGIDEETRANIFEPFFSTKGEEGTGLGLSTVYGIVKQHNGNIWVYSEVGHGTTFKIYLPVSESARIEESQVSKTPVDIRGSETILIVEDNEQVANIAQEILTLYGYKIKAAKSGTEALKICAVENTPIDLLLTDVIMPEIDGKELAKKMLDVHQNLKVLYMSGYTSNVIAHHGVLDAGIQFIQKPFNPEKLAKKVREVLDS